MRKLHLGLTALISCAVFAVSCDKESIKNEDLPNAASEFLISHFAENKILNIKEEREGLTGKEYTAILDNGTKITFDKKGQWIEAEAPVRTALPISFIPTGISSYVTKNHSGEQISSIDKEKHGYDVEITNELELVFDNQSNFLRYED